MPKDSTGEFMKLCSIPKKFKPIVKGLGYAADILVFAGVGALIDKFINKKRAAAADKKAQ